MICKSTKRSDWLRTRIIGMRWWDQSSKILLELSGVPPLASCWWFSIRKIHKQMVVHWHLLYEMTMDRKHIHRRISLQPIWNTLRLLLLVRRDDDDLFAWPNLRSPFILMMITAEKTHRFHSPFRIRRVFLGLITHRFRFCSFPWKMDRKSANKSGLKI